MSDGFKSLTDIQQLSLNDAFLEVTTRIDVQRTQERILSWRKAQKVVENFCPVPDFIWRIANVVFNGTKNASLNEGFFTGLNKILFQIAKDPVLGGDDECNSIREILDVVPHDVIASSLIIHSVCRRLYTKEHDRIWQPMLDDALIRARIGYLLGLVDYKFGAGRGMLAGFSGRCGLIILIALGTLEQAKESLDLLAAGNDFEKVGEKIYGCEPLQVSSMLLSTVGCGRDAAYGMAGFCVEGGRQFSNFEIGSKECKWQAAFAICEAIRKQRYDETSNATWEVLGFDDEKRKGKLIENAKQIIRLGHNWEWLIGC